MNALLPTSRDPFFAEPGDIRAEARTQAVEAMSRLLVWMAEGQNIAQRGLRATVALYCVRPDLLENISLEKIGVLGGCSAQAVHKLAKDFRQSMELVVK
jgi:hypothetical protein